MTTDQQLALRLGDLMHNAAVDPSALSPAELLGPDCRVYLIGPPEVAADALLAPTWTAEFMCWSRHGGGSIGLLRRSVTDPLVCLRPLPNGEVEVNSSFAFDEVVSIVGGLVPHAGYDQEPPIEFAVGGDSSLALTIAAIGDEFAEELAAGPVAAHQIVDATRVTGHPFDYRRHVGSTAAAAGMTEFDPVAGLGHAIHYGLLNDMGDGSVAASELFGQFLAYSTPNNGGLAWRVASQAADGVIAQQAETIVHGGSLLLALAGRAGNGFDLAVTSHAEIAAVLGDLFASD